MTLCGNPLEADDHEGRGSAAVTMGHIFRAVVPYIAMSLLLLLIVIVFPAIATWLPNLLG